MTYGRTYGRTDGRTDGRTHEQTYNMHTVGFERLQYLYQSVKQLKGQMGKINIRIGSAYN